MADDFVKAGREVTREVSNAVYNPMVSVVVTVNLTSGRGSTCTQGILNVGPGY